MPSGLAIARFFGTSSPITIENAVASTSATATATGWTADSGSPVASSGPLSSEAMLGSARYPTSSVVSVMPTWHADSCVDSWRSALSTATERLSPLSTDRSTNERSKVTRENSAATKTAVPRVSTTLARSSNHSVTGPGSSPRGDGGARRLGRQAFRSPQGS